MKRTNVLFVGGPLDGQRQVVDSLPMILFVPAFRPQGDAAIPSEGSVDAGTIGHQYRITHMAEDAHDAAIYAHASLQGGQVIAALAGQYVPPYPADSIQAINERNHAEKHAPEEVVAAAYLVGKYFADRRVAGWQIGPCADRALRKHQAAGAIDAERHARARMTEATIFETLYAARLAPVHQLQRVAHDLARALVPDPVDQARQQRIGTPVDVLAGAWLPVALAPAVADCRNAIINSGEQAIPKSCPRCGHAKECAAGIRQKGGA